ncbi:uncharacterized protein MONBRDRAFT_37432 [Monosiga brevicollis MX1]|uniref:Uncharacterized protein n=1 Tax=Monosiga brevicollis TaxID=81824 RepID=A9V1Q1_MONBE|nr:uncharacterized protein MONBRDRAFT_37432 [Monosiga brevicollis MX1]EDQ88483.1 predicted protein [Monosiga brevicollis MX1]|eukprot:XP_001746587.1 hypothetical protein [Monosiga brevicollis MX1]
MDAHKPRVGGHEFNDFVDTPVIVVAKVSDTTIASAAQIECSDGATVEVRFNDPQMPTSPSRSLQASVVRSPMHSSHQGHEVRATKAPIAHADRSSKAGKGARIVPSRYMSASTTSSRRESTSATGGLASRPTTTKDSKESRQIRSALPAAHRSSIKRTTGSSRTSAAPASKPAASSSHGPSTSQRSRGGPTRSRTSAAAATGGSTTDTNLLTQQNTEFELAKVYLLGLPLAAELVASSTRRCAAVQWAFVLANVSEQFQAQQETLQEELTDLRNAVCTCLLPLPFLTAWSDDRKGNPFERMILAYQGFFSPSDALQRQFASAQLDLQRQQLVRKVMQLQAAQEPLQRSQALLTQSLQLRTMYQAVEQAQHGVTLQGCKPVQPSQSHQTHFYCLCVCNFHPRCSSIVPWFTPLVLLQQSNTNLGLGTPSADLQRALVHLDQAIAGHQPLNQNEVVQLSRHHQLLASRQAELHALEQQLRACEQDAVELCSRVMTDATPRVTIRW